MENLSVVFQNNEVWFDVDSISDLIGEDVESVVDNIPSNHKVILTNKGTDEFGGYLVDNLGFQFILDNIK